MRSSAFRPVGLPIYVARIPSAPFASGRSDNGYFYLKRGNERYLIVGTAKSHELPYV